MNETVTLRPVSRSPAPVKAVLAVFMDWGGPLFPHTEIPLLQHAWDGHVRGKGVVAQALKSGVKGFSSTGCIFNPRTDDGYTWHSGHVYPLEDGGEALVMLPSQDPYGVSSRHCAIYIRGANNYMGRVSTLARMVAEAIERIQE